MDPYTIKHHKDAARERDWLFDTYGESFRMGYGNWMKEIADSALSKKNDAWFDLEEALDSIRADILPNWARNLQQFRQAGVIEKLKALISIVKNRRPPWSIKAASRPIRGLDARLTVDVGIVFDINDIKQLIVIRQVLHHAM